MADERWPDFLLIGAQKGGSSTLHWMLDQHPELAILEKEQHFFGQRDADPGATAAYRQQFGRLPGNCLVGERSTSYTQFPVAYSPAAQIARSIPGVKLIYIVRNPVIRLESAYRHLETRNKPIGPTFSETVRRYPHLVAASSYYEQWATYCQHFSPEQIHVVFFEDLCDQPGVVLESCFQFLGVTTGVDVPPKHLRNSSAGRPVYPRPLRGLVRRGWLPKRGVLGRGLRRILAREPTAQPVWDADLRARVLPHLAEDAARFLAAHGRAADYWNWER